MSDLPKRVSISEEGPREGFQSEKKIIPVAENLVERWLGRPVYGLGPALFRHGLVFSIGLTLFPAALVTFMAIGGLLFR